MDKVRAAHSDHYVQLDMVDLFETSTEVLKDSLEQVRWKSGYIDHSCAMAEYEIFDEGLLEGYKRLFKGFFFFSCGKWGEADQQKGPVDLFAVEPTDEAGMPRRP